MTLNSRKMLRHLRLHIQCLKARGLHTSEYFRLSREVEEAVRAKRPVIALESTILTHGLPADKALQVSRNLEQIAISAGVVPATIGILDGKLIVGMTQQEQAALISEAERNFAGKAALKDLPLIFSGATKHRSFGTTVSATLFAAHKANISIFATGGIGGVHRGAETSFDISSDLVALSQFPIAVVSAGVKSILDIPKTLELLETLSVPVVTHASDQFPAFFTSNSGVRSPGRVDSPIEAAKVLKIIQSQLKMKQGLLVAVPNFSTSDVTGQHIEQAIQTAVSEAEGQEVKGAAVTPFILERVRQLTGNKSFEANVELIANNVQYACEMAKHFGRRSSLHAGERILVIGGSNLDRTIKITHEGVSSSQDLHPPGSFRGEVLEQSAGGVGRNMAQVLHKLGTDCGFLTAMQPHDQHALLQDIPHQLAEVSANDRTASYVGILNKDNDLLFGVADMAIHEKIEPEVVKEFLSKRLCYNPKVVLFDLNLPTASIEEIIRFSKKNHLETWCEPTDYHKFEKIFRLMEEKEDLRGLSLVAPNKHEFEKLVAWKVGETKLETSEEIVCQARSMLDFSERFIIKRAEKGIIFVDANAAFEMSSPIKNNAEISSVSGAGDSLLAAVLHARHHLGLRNWESCLLIGLKAAEMSMRTHASVPDQWNVEEFREKHINDWAHSRDINIYRF